MSAARDVKRRKERRLNRVRQKTKQLSRDLQLPRVLVRRSLKHMFVLVLDPSGKVLLSLSTMNPEFRKACPYGGNKKAAFQLGKLIAEKNVG